MSIYNFDNSAAFSGIALGGLKWK